LKDQSGALVGEVTRNSPAGEAGMKDGDVIVALNGKPVTDSRHFRLTISQTPPGTKVTLQVIRDGKERTVSATLAELPDEIRISAQTLEPSRLTRYVTDVASLFHSFYNACRVKGEEESLMKARLLLAASTQIVIKNVLDIISIHAPEKM
jgi:arginyl-tRNA synthetase